MFGSQLRAARIALGISEYSLCRNAGIQRSQLKEAENDGNVTTETLRKILAQLPNITYLQVPSDQSPEMVEASIVADLSSKIAVHAQQLIEFSRGRRRSSLGRLDADDEIEPDESDRIRELNEAIDQGRPPIESEI